jgi:hypothetical protein
MHMGTLTIETLEEIQKTAVAASGAKDKLQLVPVPGSKIGEFAAVKPNGEFEMMTPEQRPPDRRHKLLSIEELSAYIEYAKGTLQATPVVYYSPDGIAVVLNDGTESLRADTATIELKPTKAHTTLKQSADKWLQQKDFIRLLRISLADCLGEDGAQLVKVLRLVNFKGGSSGFGKVEHGRESMGKDIEDEVTSDAGPIPEQVTLLVRLYEDRGLQTRFPVRCAVEINSREALFNLSPLAGSIEAAVDEQMSAIGSLIDQATDCPVFYGTP